MDYLQIDPRLDEHPDIVAAGFAGSVVFQAILRACASFDKRGRLPAKFSALWLARRMGLIDETVIAPANFVSMGVDACIRVGLLERETNGDLVVPGWERFYKQAAPGSVRTKNWRQRQCDVGDEVASQPSPSDARDEVPSHASQRDDTPLNTTPLNTTQQTKEEAAPPPSLVLAKQMETARTKACPQAFPATPHSHEFVAWRKDAKDFTDSVLLAAYECYLANSWARSLTPAPCPWTAWRKKWREFIPGQGSEEAPARALAGPRNGELGVGRSGPGAYVNYDPSDPWAPSPGGAP